MGVGERREALARLSFVSSLCLFRQTFIKKKNSRQHADNTNLQQQQQQARVFHCIINYTSIINYTIDK